MLKRRSERRAVARPENATLQIVAFRVGEELYGLEIGSVKEIERLQPVTKVPQSLSFVEGVVHIRGSILPVIDLARRFGLPPVAADRQSRIIVAALEGRSVGFIVTAVTEVLPIPAQAIGPPPPMTFEPSARFVTGMAKAGERLISILGLEQLLSTDEIGQLRQAQL